MDNKNRKQELNASPNVEMIHGLSRNRKAMKKIFLYAAVAVLAMSAASCQKESQNDNDSSQEKSQNESGYDGGILLPGKFTVALGKQVQFTRGNLYYSTTDSKYHIEAAQNVTYATLGQSAYDSTHVCHFFWSNTTDWQTPGKEPWASEYSYSAQSTGDKFFCGIDNSMTVDGQSSLYALTGGDDSGEWYYLFDVRTNASSLYKKGVSVSTSAGQVKNCVVIAPDDWDYTKNPLLDTYSPEEWATAEASGLVCLPAAGLRNGSTLLGAGSDGYYWSATPYGDYEYHAYGLHFSGSSVSPSSFGNRLSGYSVRLVCSVSK